MRAAVCLAVALALFTAGTYLAAAVGAWWSLLLASGAYIGGAGFVFAAWEESKRG